MIGPGGRRAVLAAMAVGCVLRLIFAFGYWIDKPLTHDEREYLQLARNLAEGKGFDAAGVEPSPDRERFGRAPMYPAFLALLGGGGDITDRRLDRIRAGQVLVGVLMIPLVASIAGRAAGARAAAPAAWLTAVYPPFVWMPAYIFSETLYSCLALAGVRWLSPVLDAPLGRIRASARRPWFLVGAGVLSGAAALTRPGHLFFLLLVGLWLVLRARRLDWALLLAAGSLLAIGPWTVRNYFVYSRPVLIAAQGGINFWIGNHPLARGEGDMAANPGIKRDNMRLRAAHPGLSPEELEPIYYRHAFRAIAEDPVWWAGLLLRKVFYVWMPIGPSYTLHSPRYLVASVASYGFLLPIGLAGIAALRGAPTWPRALILLAGSVVLASMVFLPQERYRIPALDPLLVVGAAAVAALVVRTGGSTASRAEV